MAVAAVAVSVLGDWRFAVVFSVIMQQRWR